MLSRLAVLGLILGIASATATVRAAEPVSGSSQRLSFDVSEGLNFNSFLRDGPVAAHLVLRSGVDPRILIAFPAGDTGIGLWFSHGTQSVAWKMLGRPQPTVLADAQGRPLYGISVEVAATGAAELPIKRAVLSGVRVLRNYQADGTLPIEVSATPTIEGSTITWARDRIDGAAGYVLRIEVTRGSLKPDRIAATDGDAVELKITAVSGERPLTPLTSPRLLNAAAQPDQEARDVLTFLSFQEAFLAGSWRFDTYFGRDTLMSVRLLMPALTPNAVDAGLGAVLTRLSPDGEVAHEENIGEFVVLEHRTAGINADAPSFDYKMIDATFMLAPVAAAWLLDDGRGRVQARQFLRGTDGHTAQSHTMGADLMRNLRFVLHAAAPFAGDPRAANLIALKPGVSVGEWRDSSDGLVGGRLPYDVNAVLVPAALESAGRLYAAGLLDPFLEAADGPLFAGASRMAQVWLSKAAPLFDVEVSNADARQRITQYAASLAVPDAAALRAVGSSAVRFHALALDADGSALPVLHSDEGFELLFGRPDAAQLDRAVRSLIRPFPAGLLTPVGVVVANPVYASTAIQALLTRSAYHGSVVWSWQQAVLAAGLQRQLRRGDLPESTKVRLRKAQRGLWHAIRAGHVMRNSELWSWSFANGQYGIVPFGTNTADVDESNAAQLWSTVYLAIADPFAVRAAPPAAPLIGASVVK